MPIFVSYARADAAVVKDLYGDLEQVHSPVWMDSRLSGGQAWWDTILEQIRACDLFVVALSPDSIRSEACNAELDYALALDRPLLPVLVRDVAIQLAAPAIASTQYVDYRVPSRQAAFELIGAVTKREAAPALPSPLPNPPPPPMSYMSDFRELADAPRLSYDQQKHLLLDLRDYYVQGGDRRELAEQLIRTLRRRGDIAYTVARDIDDLFAEESRTGATPAPAEAPPPAAPARQATPPPAAPSPPVSQPSANQPRANQPRANQPAANQPGGSQPGGSQPGGSQPGGSQPGGSQPGGSQPGGSQPGGSQPGGSQPGGYQPGAYQPGAYQPRPNQGFTGVPANQPPMNQPMSQPSANPPPAYSTFGPAGMPTPAPPRQQPPPARTAPPMPVYSAPLAQPPRPMSAAGGESHPQGTTVLVLGIIGLVLCPIVGIFALTIGSKALKQIDAQPGRYRDRGMVVAGRWLGIGGLVLWTTGFLIYIVLVVVSAGSYG